ncbi:MAG: TolC family protein, partial [Planctomycetes bacterium]|nr:TolC family protein [Planctomycetota bacterium]
GLEESMWAAQLEVDAALIRLAAVRAAKTRLDALIDEAMAEVPRLRILEQHGRISSGALSSFQLTMGKLLERRAQIVLDVVSAREALANATGLAADAPALDVPGAQTLDAWESRSGVGSMGHEPDACELLVRIPRLRGLLLEYAIAEARLRQAATRRWPSLAIGPHLSWSDPDLLVGALLGSEIPWPGSLEGEVLAASSEREAARERVEDGLQAFLVRCRSASDRRVASLDLLHQGAKPAAEESARLWQAARARFSIDPTGLEALARAMEVRANALQGLELARAEALIAELQFEWSQGPDGNAPRLVASPIAEVTQ